MYKRFLKISFLGLFVFCQGNVWGAAHNYAYGCPKVLNHVQMKQLCKTKKVNLNGTVYEYLHGKLPIITNLRSKKGLTATFESGNIYGKCIYKYSTWILGRVSGGAQNNFITLKKSSLHSRPAQDSDGSMSDFEENSSNSYHSRESSRSSMSDFKEIPSDQNYFNPSFGNYEESHHSLPPLHSRPPMYGSKDLSSWRK